MVPLEYYLIVAGIIFTIGMIGVIFARNIIIIFMAIELMLNAANLAMIAFSRNLGSMGGHVMVFMIMTVAAAEAAVGLSIIIALFRNRDSANIDEVNLMKW
ncbi:MAG: NADH-quinone oxidoreductase subunit NuoK [candidate division Zixibacteria bacterium]|jgi:NADH-quinone oxidoreductase subunit K|nr:NADH-quinone oxidoreductase subunit NuoK [candidate division Zixibacteria bacterium]